jgi:uncharacterized protein YuzE
MSSPLLTYDPEASTINIRFTNADIAERIELSENVTIDLDAEGDPVEIEVAAASTALAGRLPTAPESIELRELLGQHTA